MNAVILRQDDKSVQTFGDFTIFNGTRKMYECKTLELAWKNNENKISCIPAGEYECEKVGPTKKIPYPHIWIKDVPGRAGVKIHIGNFASFKKTDSEGCVLPGLGYKDINADGILDIISSGNAFRRIMELVPNKFTLTIV